MTAVAEALQISVPAAKSRLLRARTELRLRLRHHGIYRRRRGQRPHSIEWPTMAQRILRGGGSSSGHSVHIATARIIWTNRARRTSSRRA